MAVWTFLRHGESVANAEGWLSGHRDVPLTERGVAQAIAAGRALRDHPFGQAWTSDLQRAHHTARLVLADRAEPALQISAALRERKLGVLEGRDKQSLRDDGGMAVLVTWDGRPAGAESHRDLAIRALPFLAGIDGRGDTLLVAHGGLIRVLVGLIDGTPLTALGKVTYDNAVPVHRDVPVGRWAELRLDLG